MTEITKEFFLASLMTQYSQSELTSMWNWLHQDNIVVTNHIIERLGKHEPLQYITGYTWFYGNKIDVTTDTLIPRPETEELCDIILKSCQTKSPIKALDVGTGSGCIPITLAMNNDNFQFQAIDISTKALEIARHNIHKYQLQKKIKLVEIDFLAAPKLDSDFQMIISNPPYIAYDEMTSMEPNVLNWEPKGALFAQGKDALIFYRHLSNLLSLQTGVCELWAEINPLFADETQSIFQDLGRTELHKDMSGKFRFLHIKKEGL